MTIEASEEIAFLNEQCRLLQAALQASQKENAALKVQVNEKDEQIERLQNMNRCLLGEDDKCTKTMLIAKEQSLTAHDNEVIELCINKIIDWDADETLTIFQLIQAIRKLKKEGE